MIRPIREGIRGVGRHWAMSLSSAIAVTVTLMIISLFLVLSYHLEQFTRSVESSVEISVMVSYDAESTSSLKQIKKAIAAIDGVERVTYSSKDDELKYYINSFEDERTRAVFEPFKADNPMHDAYYVETKNGANREDIAKKIGQINGVDSVNYGGQSTLNMVDAMSSIRRFGGILVAALTLLAIFLIQNTIKLTIYARKDEITIMKHVGATNGFIRAPFLWEGIITGILGAIIPIGLTIWGYIVIFEKTSGVLISNMFRLEKAFPFLYYISGILLLVGILVGLFGSWLSVTKYLRDKR